MLTILLITAMLGQGQSWDSFGKNFLTVFPENIAFYYPVNPVNALNITALYSDAVVNVYVSNTRTYQNTLPAGQAVTVNLPLDVEEYNFGQTLRTVRIISTKNIVVQWISQRGDSVQADAIQPLKNLGTFYSIPFLNNSLYQSARNISKRFSSFRLVIINAEEISSFVQIIKMPRNKTDQYTLAPYTALQLQIDGTEVAVQSDYRVVVMLTHPCVEMAECRCSMVVNQLSPDYQWGSRFVVPSMLSTSNVWLHLTSSTSGDLDSDTFEPSSSSSKLLPLPSLQLGSQIINTSDPASLRLVGPGFIIQLIPQSKFSACYLVAPVSSTGAKAVVIAETEHRDSVYIDGDLLSSNEWSTIADSEYSSVSVPLDNAHVIWHPYTKIAVYVFEKSVNLYGGPAIALSAKPDPLGCALVPSKLDIVLTPQTWPESHQNCMLISDELFTPSNKAAQMGMVDVLNSIGLKEGLWIGLRRSLLTLEWYQRKGKEEYEMTYRRWRAGEPHDAVNGMCASVFPNSSMDFHWQTVPCCAQLKSICYTRGLYFSVDFSTSNEETSDSSTQNGNSQ